MNCNICQKNEATIVVDQCDNVDQVVCVKCFEEESGVDVPYTPSKKASLWFAELGEKLDADGSLTRDREELEREIEMSDDEYIQHMADRFGGR